MVPESEVYQMRGPQIELLPPYTERAARRISESQVARLSAFHD